MTVVLTSESHVDDYHQKATSWHFREACSVPVLLVVVVSRWKAHGNHVSHQTRFLPPFLKHGADAILGKSHGWHVKEPLSEYHFLGHHMLTVFFHLPRIHPS